MSESCEVVKPNGTLLSNHRDGFLASHARWTALSSPGKPDSGNPAAVVLEQGLGRTLTESERRNIAAHLNQPVTAFVATTMVVSPRSVLQVCVCVHDPAPWLVASG